MSNEYLRAYREQSPWGAKPSCIVISDVHFSLNNMDLALAAFKAAIAKAIELKLPLIDCGDLTNDKAILRGEYVNSLIEVLSHAKTKGVQIILLVGNHSLVNEKGKEHVLHFLKPYATIIDTITVLDNYAFIPYQSNNNDFLKALYSIPPGYLVFTHQGVKGAFMGDYIQDKSSVELNQLSSYRIISGHYHRHQTLGSVTYIGSPYTITYGEANDGPKGFLIVNQDGTFTREILNLRKHIIIERRFDDHLYDPVANYNPGDLVRVKLTGPKQLLNQIDKQSLGLKLIGHSNFRLDLVAEESTTRVEHTLNLTDNEIMLQLIEDNAPNLKEVYLEVMSEIESGQS